MIEDYWKYDGLGLAELIRNGEVTALELVDSAIDAVRRLNPALNAVCHDLADRGRRAASSLSAAGPFAGVPFLLKDIGAQMRGTPYECGSRLMRGYVSNHDSNLTERFEQAGLITIGKTTTPEFGAQITTESVLTGVTHNPWSKMATPGGSSGGSAAAVAAGIVPIAHANDGLGSIRIPAANCGLFGLKPTRQRTPAGPYAAEVSGSRGVEFVVSRSVRDSAALLDAVHGADIGAPHWAPPPQRPYADEISRKPTSLRVAVCEQTFSGKPIHADCRRAVQLIADTCATLGHSLDAAMPRIDWDAYMWAIRTAGSASFAAGVDGAANIVGRTPGEDNLEPLTWLSYVEGRQLLATDYFRALDVFAKIQRVVGRFFENHDVLITPMLSMPTPDIGWLGRPDSDLDGFWQRFAGDAYSPFAGVFNVSGHPAAAVPTFETEDRRPIGVQIISRFGAEGTLLSLAAQIEAARPWQARRPELHISNAVR